MYESIQGILKDKDPNRAIIETAGIGYRLSIPLSAYAKLPPIGTSTYFYLSQVVREDSNTLYAFLCKEERNLFETLITLSGIGPKTGLSIIGHIDIDSFQSAVAASDSKLLSKIPGIGKKTAEKLVIEMRDKFKGKGKGSTVVGDAVTALLNLGYSPVNAQKAVQAVLEEKKNETDLAKIITAALQKI